MTTDLQPTATRTADWRGRSRGRRRAAVAFLAVAALGIATAPSLASAQTTIPPATPPGPNPDNRAYELVTPPDKNNRRGAGPRPVDVPNPGLPSQDGDALLFRLSFGILDPNAGTGFPYQTDTVLIRRGPQGWRGEAANNFSSGHSAALPADNAQAVAGDLTVLAWFHAVSLFPATDSRFGTRVFDASGGESGSGWFDWFADQPTPPADQPSLAEAAQNNDDEAVLLADDGGHMLRWGKYTGLLGASDPSGEQVAGWALYSQAPPSDGPRELVHECTGSSGTASATEVVIRLGSGTATDTLGALECAAGEVTSARGAVAGAGSRDPDDGAGVVNGPAATALSVDGRRAFFTSPDPAAAGLPATDEPGCTPATGAESVCNPQLFVWQVRSDGERVVRWVSRSEVDGQQVGLLGRGVGFEGSSDDGRVVYFRTNAPLTADDPNGAGVPPPAGGVTEGVASSNSWDLYRYELPADLDADPAAGSLTRVSGGPDGLADPNTNCTNIATSGVHTGDCSGNSGSSASNGAGTAARYISDDGSRAYFVTAGSIPGADNSPPAGSSAGNTAGGASTNTTARNLYLYENESGVESWKFVARLPFARASGSAALDACATSSTQPSPPLQVHTDVVARAPNASCVRGTPAGDALVFETSGQLTADDSDAAGDVYLYDADGDELVRVSAPRMGAGGPYGCGGGSVCNADLGVDAVLGQAAKERYGRGGFRHYNLASDSGGGLRAVYFESRLSLVEGDVNGRMDVYEWAPGRGLSLVSPGQPGDDSYYSGNSLDGQDVFFWTSRRIDPRELEDADFDVYDARAGGGFPLAVAPAVCGVLAGGCEGAGSVAPAVSVPGSVGLVDRGGAGRPAGRVLRVAAVRGRLGRRLGRRGRVAIRVRAPRAGRLVVRSKRARRVVRRVDGGPVERLVVGLDRRSRRVLRARGRVLVRLVVRFGGQRRVVRMAVRRPR